MRFMLMMHAPDTHDGDYQISRWSPEEFTARAGDHAAAVRHYRSAAERTASLPERDYLLTKAARLAAAGGWSVTARTTVSYEHRVRVLPEDIDEQAHVNNVVYVRWAQDVAIAHWQSLTTAETRATVGWVLRRHEIDYHSPAVAGDEVLVRTEVGQLEGLTFERLTEMRHAGDGRVLARSRTLWVPVDPRTGRPRRVSADLRALFSAAGNRGGTPTEAS